MILRYETRLLSTERGALLSAFTGYGKHQRVSECSFFRFRGVEFLMDQAGRSAISSEADEDMEVDLCLRATELRSVCMWTWTLTRLFIFPAHRRSNSSATGPQSDIIVETERRRLFTALYRRMVVICHWIAGNCRVVGNAVHISKQFTSGTSCTVH